MKIRKQIDVKEFYNIKNFVLALLLVCFTILVFTTSAKANQEVSIASAQETILKNTDLPQRIQIYRVYNPNTGEHLYTKDVSEKEANVKDGWKDEGIGWWVSPRTSSKPVYRMYNPNAGDHHYTPSKEERDSLVKFGWVYEKVAWYEPENIEPDQISVYRAYNPNEWAWNHFYTKNEKEQENLMRAGWLNENIAWCAYENLQTDISGASVSLSNKLTYNGSTQKQELIVKLGSKTLQEGSDYTVTGNSSKEVGSHVLTIRGIANAGYSGTITKTYMIDQRELSIKNIEVNNKEYDQNSNASIKLLEVEGVCDNEDVEININVAFNDSEVENDKILNVTNVSLVGQNKANYVFNDDKKLTNLRANITPKQLEVSNIKVNDKEYDKKNQATIDLKEVKMEQGLTGEEVDFESIKAHFVDVSAGDNKEVVVDEIKLKGENANNYIGVVGENEKLQAKISKKKITIENISLKDRTYEKDNKEAVLDTSTNRFSKNAVCIGDEVVVKETTFSYEDDNAENDKEVRLSKAPEITGRDALNYSVTGYPSTVKGTVLAIVRYSTNCETFKEEEHVKVDSLLTKDETGLQRVGLKIENWYTDEKCTDDDEHRWNFSSDSVNQNITTLYANWVPNSDSSKYWISPSMNISSGVNETGTIKSNENYVKEEWNVKKSYQEIRNDLDVLKNKDNYETEKYEKVKSEYDSFLKNDNYHLYTKYKGETETSDGNEDEKNSYLESRVIQVGSHDDDGSGLTFQATHLLPQALSMNQTETNLNGWDDCTPNKAMAGIDQSFKYRYYSKDTDSWLTTGIDLFKGSTSCFNQTFMNDLKKVTKKYNAGNKSSREEASEGDYKIWLLSYSEVDSKHLDEGEPYWPKGEAEGSTYQWFTEHNVNLLKGNAILSYKTRNGKVPRNYFYDDSNYVYWWLRSPKTNTVDQFLYINNEGHKGSYGIATNSLGIVPAFAL